jgi:hypothetical protein
MNMNTKKYFVSAFLSAVALVGMNIPVNAADDESKTVFDDVATLTVDSAALGTSMVVDIPISVCTTVPQSIGDIACKIHRDMGSDDSITSHAVADGLALPVGTVYGVAAGTINGTKHALGNYHDLVDTKFWGHLGFNVQ